MTGTPYLDGRVIVHAGDCAEVLRTRPDDSVDAVVTDPPYHLTSIVQRFGGEKAAPAQYGTNGAYARASAGFMGKQWDGGDIAFRPELWAEVLRVLKPGGHMLAFGGTRTYHRMVCAIEDAGFEVRDQIMWVYATGFPKSHDVSKGIDKAAGAEREVVGPRRLSNGRPHEYNIGFSEGEGFATRAVSNSITAPATSAAHEWQGWGSALKPSHEPIVLARKPLSEPTIAANVQRWGTGAINIDGCRVGTDGGTVFGGKRNGANDLTVHAYGDGLNSKFAVHKDGLGRWPANIVHDGSDEVLAAFPVDAGGGFGKRGGNPQSMSYGFAEGDMRTVGYGDTRSAARFFYAAKADDDSRLGSKHPTVKPLDLLQYLVRLITPRGGTVLDCFAGTGTTAEAAIREGCRAVLIEREPEYLVDIARRCSLILAGPDTRLHATIKAKGRPEEPLPLFAELEIAVQAAELRPRQVFGNFRRHWGVDPEAEE